jgi:hypothetical protein
LDRAGFGWQVASFVALDRSSREANLLKKTRSHDKATYSEKAIKCLSYFPQCIVLLRLSTNHYNKTDNNVHIVKELSCSIVPTRCAPAPNGIVALPA